MRNMNNTQIKTNDIKLEKIIIKYLYIFNLCSIILTLFSVTHHYFYRLMKCQTQGRASVMMEILLYNNSFIIFFPYFKQNNTDFIDNI